MLNEFKIVGGKVDKNYVWLKVEDLGTEEARVRNTTSKFEEFLIPHH